MRDTDATLMVRALMRRLWQKYDSGGHSMGRSPRAALLEAVLWKSSNVLPIIPDDSREAFEEIRTRISPDERVECVSATLPELSEEMFTTLVIHTIQEIVREMIDSSIIEENILGVIFHLLNGERRLALYRQMGGEDVEVPELIREGMSRRERERV